MLRLIGVTRRPCSHAAEARGQQLLALRLRRARNSIHRAMNSKPTTASQAPLHRGVRQPGRAGLSQRDQSVLRPGKSRDGVFLHVASLPGGCDNLASRRLILGSRKHVERPFSFRECSGHLLIQPGGCVRILNAWTGRRLAAGCSSGCSARARQGSCGARRRSVGSSRTSARTWRRTARDSPGCYRSAGSASTRSRDRCPHAGMAEYRLRGLRPRRPAAGPHVRRPPGDAGRGASPATSSA